MCITIHSTFLWPDDHLGTSTGLERKEVLRNG